MRLETIRLAGELAIPFTSGILIGIGETRAERLDALLALRALGDEHGHLGEVIVQNFRAKPGTRMADHPGCDARRAALDGRRGAHPARRRLARAGAAEPRLRRLPAAARRRASTTGAASRRSRSTTSIPRRRGPRSSGCARRPRRAGSRSRRGCRSTPSTSPTSTAGSTRPSLPPCAVRRTRSASPARIAGRPASRSRCRSSSGATRSRSSSTGEELGRDEIVRLLSARGERARARVRGGRPAATRGVRRRGHLRRDAEHPVHERLLLQVRLLRVLEGQAGREPARPRVPRADGRDRAALAGGVGARRDRGLPAGRHPPGVHGRLLRRGRRLDPRGGAGHPRPRVLRARGVAGRGDARPLARGRTSRGCAISGSARCRARRPRSSTTRCARSSAPTRSRPTSGSRCTMPPTASACART